MENEREHIIRLKQGSSNAFEKIYRYYWERVYSFARLYLKDKNEAEEVVQEVFLRLWDSRLLLHEEEGLKGYLFIITRNYIFNQERRHFNREFFELSMLQALESDTDIEAEIEAHDLGQYIDRLVDEMPPQRKEVFTLSRRRHLSYKEIAQQLNISEKTVERHINEALRFLRKNLPLLILFARCVGIHSLPQ